MRKTTLSFVLLLLLGATSWVHADASPPTQEEVFKSISSNVDQSVDGRKVVAVLIAGAALVMLGFVYNRQQTRQTAPAKLNHQGKLLKELIKRGGLTRAQAKQLRLRADACAAAGEPLDSPITLLLCPSLLQGHRE